MESRNDWMMTLRWSTENIRWNSMAQRSPDSRNHIRTGNQANVSLKSIFFFEVKYSGNLNSFFNVTRLLELELGIWRCYSPILVETLLRAFFRYDHTNPFDSRAAHFEWLPFWCKECCDCNMHVIFAGAENKEKRNTFLESNVTPRNFNEERSLVVSEAFAPWAEVWFSFLGQFLAKYTPNLSKYCSFCFVTTRLSTLRIHLPVDDDLGPFVTILNQVVCESYVSKSLVLTSHSLAAQLLPQVG